MSSTKRPPKTRKAPVPTQSAEAKVKQRRGQPTLCTHEIADLFARCIGMSPWMEPAAGMCGIGVRTAYDWMRRGTEEQELIEAGNLPRESEEPFLYFAQAVARARAKWEIDLTMTVARKSLPNDPEVNPETSKPYESQGDAHLALSVLKAAFPDRWGARELKVKSEVKVNREPVDLSALTDEELEVYARAVERLAGPESDDDA